MADVCKWCGAPVVFGVSTKLRRVPVQEDAHGTWVLLPPDKATGRPERRLRPYHGEMAQEPRYRRHADVCTDRRRG